MLKILANRQGLEPQIAALETAVLPVKLSIYYHVSVSTH